MHINQCQFVLKLMLSTSARELIIWQNWSTRLSSSQMERVSSGELWDVSRQNDPALEGRPVWSGLSVR